MSNIIDFPKSAKKPETTAERKLYPFQLAALNLLREKAGLYSGIRKGGKQSSNFNPEHPHANLYRRGDVVALINHPDVTGTVIESFYSITLRRVIGLLVCFPDFTDRPVFATPENIFVIRANA